jgi:hypothetical protein
MPISEPAPDSPFAKQARRRHSSSSSSSSSSMADDSRSSGRTIEDDASNDEALYSNDDVVAVLDVLADGATVSHLTIATWDHLPCRALQVRKRSF